jgi:two-component system, NarL family, sensor histidine kinase UhpB
LRASYARVRALAQELERVREQERQSLARELHDEFGQLLAALRIDASWIRRKTQDVLPEIAERASAMAHVIERVQQAAKRMTSELRPPVLDDSGLVPALRSLVDEFAERHDVTCELHISDDGRDIGDPLATPLYRITQEALTNITKHAQATRVRVELVTGRDTVTLIIADNGRGLTEADRRKPGSFGLVGMQERAAAVGGELGVSSTAGEGVTIEIQLPLARGKA